MPKRFGSFAGPGGALASSASWPADPLGGAYNQGMGNIHAGRIAQPRGREGAWRVPFARLVLRAALALSLSAAACHRMLPVDTAPLDQTGMSYDAIQELKTLEITSPEVAEVVKAHTGGFSEADCVEAVRIYHDRREVFHAGDAVAGLTRVGISDDTILDLARLNQLGFDAGEFQAMRLAGLSEAIILEVARHRAAGKPVLAGASLAQLRNTGVNEATLLELARRGVPDSKANAILAYRHNGASDAQILREFSSS